jgi:tRNA(Phe) wybutosine-synthesizing methylase Tyw3
VLVLAPQHAPAPQFAREEHELAAGHQLAVDEETLRVMDRRSRQKLLQAEEARSRAEDALTAQQASKAAQQAKRQRAMQKQGEYQRGACEGGG